MREIEHYLFVIGRCVLRINEHLCDGVNKMEQWEQELRTVISGK